MALWRRLEEISLANVAEFGGKAARLGEALHLGCPMPPAVVLSTELYRRFMRQGGLQGEVASILATLQPSTLTHFQAAEWAIHQAFEVRRVPDLVVATVREAWQALGNVPVVVRSSATSEDSPQQSFVGQHLTCLDVRTEKDLIAAVLGCWRSLFSAKALAYAHRFGVDLLASAMAVLIQQQVSPSAGGALFTADPISGDPDVFVLEVQWGPEVGVHRLDPYKDRPGEPHFWKQLRRMGLLLDEHHLAYQTIEWVVVEGEVQLLRVRPMTKTPPYVPPSAVQEVAAQGPLELLHPPGISARALCPYSWYQRSRSAALKAAFFRRAHPLFSLWLGRDDFFVCGYLYVRWRRSRLPAHDAPLPLLPYLWYAGRRLWAARHLDRGFWALRLAARPRLDALNLQDLGRLSAQELRHHLQEVAELTEAFLTQSGCLGNSAEALVHILGWLHQRWLGEEGQVWELVRGEEDQRARRDKDFARVARASYATESEREAAFRAVFRRHRHLFLRGRPLEEGQDLANLREDEAAARATFHAWAVAEGASPSEERSRLLAQRGALEQRLLARLGPPRRWVYARLLQLARRYVPLRVDRDEAVLLSWLLERDAVLEVGRRLQQAGLVTDAEEAFLLTQDEIFRWLDQTLPREQLASLLEERRALRRRWWRYAPPEVLQESEVDKISLPLAPHEEDVLHGRQISPGIARGRVRIVRTLGETTNVLPGEVLVCHEALFEFSPVFGLVSAVITEVGGLLDHSAVLIREYGIPAIFGVERATERLHTGEEVQVDAYRGIIVRHCPEPQWDIL